MKAALVIQENKYYMKNSFIIIILFAFTAFATSCGTTKKLNTAISKKDTAQVVIVKDPHADSMLFIKNVYNQIQTKKIDFNTFSAKIKVDYWDKDGKGPDLTVFARIKKDSIIWLSINATIVSYEAFRVLITPDSVKMLDKKNKLIKFRSVEYLQDIVKIPLDFKSLQDLLIGNPVFLDSNITAYKVNANDINLLSLGAFFKNLLTCDNNNYRVTHSKLDEISDLRNITCDLTYDGYQNADNKDFATRRQVTVVDKSKLEVQMEFKQFSFNENLGYPFAIPKNYKKE